MKNAKRIYDVGQLILVLGSLMYLAELLLKYEAPALTTAIAIVYVISLVLILIGWIGTRDERRAEKERRKQEEAAQKAAKRAAKDAA